MSAAREAARATAPAVPARHGADPAGGATGRCPPLSRALLSRPSARAVLLAVLAALACARPPGATAAGRRADAFAIQSRMGRGVNILSADPMWDDPGSARFKLEDFARIRAGGFRTVRINLQAFRHMDARGRLDPRWLETLDRMVTGALAAQLIAILDEHDFDACSRAPSPCLAKLEAFWRQIERRFHDRSHDILFEFENEPHDPLTAELWNRFAGRLLAIIRRRDRDRIVVIGPGSYNDGRMLDRLRLPAADRGILVTVHYYRPMRFTHQGAPWSRQTAGLQGIGWGSRGDRERLDGDLDAIERWALRHRRPILLGEFGAYERAPAASRVAYDAAVARGAERRGWAWCYWQFDGDFVVFDVAKDAWVEPIWRALVPAGAAEGRAGDGGPTSADGSPAPARGRIGPVGAAP